MPCGEQGPVALSESGQLAPRKHSWRAGSSSSHRRPGRVAAHRSRRGRPTSSATSWRRIQGIGLAAADAILLARLGRPDLSRRSRHLSHPGPPRLARRLGRRTTRPASSWCTRPAGDPDELARLSARHGRARPAVFCRASAAAVRRAARSRPPARGGPARAGRLDDRPTSTVKPAREPWTDRHGRLPARGPEAGPDVRGDPAQEARLLRQGPGSARRPVRRAGRSARSRSSSSRSRDGAGRIRRSTRRPGSRRSARPRAATRSTRWTAAISRRRARSTSGCW